MQREDGKKEADIARSWRCERDLQAQERQMRVGLYFSKSAFGPAFGPGFSRLWIVGRRGSVRFRLNTRACASSTTKRHCVCNYQAENNTNKVSPTYRDIYIA
jgi:hypothetical protein